MIILKLINELYSYFNNKEKCKFFYLVFSSLISSFLEIFVIFLIVNSLKIASSGQEFYIEKLNYSVQIQQYLIATILLLALSSWYRYKHLFWMTEFSYNFSVKLSNKLLFTLLNKPFLFYKKSKSSELVDLMVIKNNVLGPSVVLPFIKLTAGLIMLIIMSIASIIYLGYFSIIGIFSVLILFFIISLKSRSIKIYNSNLISKINPQVLSAINQSILGFRDVKLNKLENIILINFTNLLNTRSQVQISNEIISHGPKIVIEGIAFILLIIFVFYMILFSENKSDIFILITLIALSIHKFLPVVQQIYLSATTITINSSIFNDINNFIKSFENNNKEKSLISYFNRSIKIDNISFKYPDGKEIIKNLSLELHPGDLVAISGKSGVGKSTFLDIFSGFLVPTEGRIVCDNFSIDDSFGSTNIAYVPQRNFIFNGNFLDNIALGIDSNSIDLELFYKALKISQLYDFIENLPKKEFTDLGENGAILSGGLQQRVGIARAIYMNRPILLLDEATSALDNQTENLLFDSLLSYAKKENKLCIVVTHKIELLNRFDFSYIFKNKKLVNWINL